MHRYRLDVVEFIASRFPDYSAEFREEMSAALIEAYTLLPGKRGNRSLEVLVAETGTTKEVLQRDAQQFMSDKYRPKEITDDADAEDVDEDAIFPDTPQP